MRFDRTTGEAENPTRKLPLRDFGVGEQLNISMAPVATNGIERAIDINSGALNDLKEMIVLQSQQAANIANGIVFRGYGDQTF